MCAPVTHVQSALLDDMFYVNPDAQPDSKPTYLKEMDRYNAMNCSSNTQHDRPLVK